MSQYQDKLAIQRQREANKANGTCVTCGGELCYNLDGSLSKYCQPCKDIIVRRAKPNRPARSEDGEIVQLELCDRADYKAALREIGAFIKESEACTVGSLRRAFPEHESIIWDVLHDLKLSDRIDFSESSPPPTKIVSKGMRWVRGNPCQQVPSKRRKIDPYAESIFGQKHAKVF